MIAIPREIVGGRVGLLLIHNHPQNRKHTEAKKLLLLLSNNIISIRIHINAEKIINL